MKRKTQSDDYEILITRKLQLEQNSDVRAYLDYEKLDYTQKKDLRDKWTEYYLKVKEGRPYQIFMELREALKKPQFIKNEKDEWVVDKSIISKLTEENRVIMENQTWLPKPSKCDPSTFSVKSDVVAYQAIIQKLSELPTVYESSDSIDDSQRYAEEVFAQ